jgi:glycosyltransferase involved in cell wall biosynthesis
MTIYPEKIFQNAAWASGAPVLSVLIPFLGDDPSTLIRSLGKSIKAGKVELIAFDDGTNNEALTNRVSEALRAIAMPGRLVSSRVNLGRAKGRNRLARFARGNWLLFLDADMAPDSPDFLKTYLDLIAAHAPAVAFGGFSLDQAPDKAEHALHRRMALASDCASVEVRRDHPEKHVFTSNLMVRRDVFAAHGFDEGFSGWGWEDVEWAMRVARHHWITHIDNTATHLGLDAAATLVAKYEQSAGNFARVVKDHPTVVERYPSYRAARLLKRVPLRGAWRPVLKSFALAEAAPLAARALAMRLYRAALYAEAV